MLSKIDLKNYKSYNNSSIELHPITVLCGGNSSGKTSIIKSILMMKQSFEATGNNYLLINGPYTNNCLQMFGALNPHRIVQKSAFLYHLS